MRRTIQTPLPVLVLSAAATIWLSGCESAVPERPRVRPGMTKAEVLSALGEPSEKKITTKQSERIWGPPEEWWDELETGAALETWNYRYPDEGTYSVYFLRGEEKVSHTAFSPKGVVYESRP